MTALRKAEHKAFDNTLSSRFECKYLVSAQVADRIRAWMRPYMRPDAYARDKPGFRYEISSLYLDSSDLALLQMTQNGEKNRFKLRVRTYSDRADDPVFFEVKKRMDGIVYKRRARLTREQAAAFLDSNVRQSLRPQRIPEANFQEFAQLARMTSSRPMMRVRYLREAYESLGHDPVRITFDTDLHGALTYGNDLGHRGGPWHHTKVGGVILEIKFTDRFPSWVGQMVEDLNLERQSVAKYVLSMEQALAERRCRVPMVGTMAAI